MPSFERDSRRIVIAGASSLLGAELKSLLEESRFAEWDLQLVDEESAAGTLTEAGGEPAVIQPVEESTFDRARYVFFTGSFEFTLANLELAHRSGAATIDLSGHSAAGANSLAWFPGLEKLRGEVLPGKPTRTFIPSAVAEAMVRLSLSLQDLGLSRLTSIVFQPVSAAGKRGIEELETQTSQLLSFQSAGKQVFDAQVAFNTLDRLGPPAESIYAKRWQFLERRCAPAFAARPWFPRFSWCMCRYFTASRSLRVGSWTLLWIQRGSSAHARRQAFPFFNRQKLRAM